MRLVVVVLSLLLSVAAGCAQKDCMGHDGKRVKQGAGAPAADGCNQCTCTESGLACTVMACVQAPAEKTPAEKTP